MKKTTFFKTVLLLCALIVGSGTMWADDYELYSGALTEGDYIIVYSGRAMNTTVSSDRLQYATVTPSNNVITTTNSAIVWHIAPSNTYWTIYNAAANKYAASTGAKSKAQMLESGSDDKSLWTVSGTSTYNFVNKKNTANEVNAYLRNNGTYGFACYAEGTGGALSLYKKKAVVATALDVKGTSTNKTKYKVGEKLNLTGLVLDATIGGDHVDVTSGYTASIGGATVTSGSTNLSSVGAHTITYSYGGQEATETIYVGELQSIAITTAPTKTEYDEGQSFNPAGMVVKATFSDEEDTPTQWQITLDGEEYSYSPTTALTPSNTSITVSYTWNEVEKTTTQAITVTAGVPYRVSFNAGTGSCATSYLDEASFGAGVKLPTPTISVTGWSFAGWATASTTNTEVKPTLYAAGETYNPTDNTTLYAVYKFTETYSGKYMQTTSLSDVTSASTIVLVNQNEKAINGSLATNVTFSADGKGWITPTDAAIYSLSGNNSDGFTLTNSDKKLGGASKSNATMASDASNSLWTFSVSGYSTGYFRVDNKSISGESLEFYSNAWKVYTSGDGAAFAFKVFIPAEITVYNSNPAAMASPTVAFKYDGGKLLYVQNTNTYDNPATVTGISKTATYTSSDETVATVTSAGVVTALKAGETTITATVAKEVGVNTEASVTYDVTVKDASNIAGIKAITDASSVVTFTADLTDAVVTYVNGSHAYIQDDSGAIYASCGSSLTAGKKINGAVSGSVKAAYKIDEITAIDLSGATQTDGDIPDAAVITAATLAANKADYEGKLVSIEDATVTESKTSGTTSGGKISDDSKVNEINLYAPDSNIEALKDAEGTFNGYVSLYTGTTVRLNIYEQSQITLTKNAPTAQPLTFASDAVELDEETDAYSAFTGQTVSGAVGDVTYSIDSDDDGVVTSIDDETGVVVLSGELGTATIKASAAAKEVTVAGVTTPYTATTQTYTITVYPRYTVTFNINGTADARRQATHGVEIAIPSPAAIGDYVFKGWSTTTVAATDVAPSMTEVTNAPTANATYYAVFAREIPGDDETSEYYKNTGATGKSGDVTASGTTNSTAINGNPSPSFNTSSDAVTFTGINISSYKAASLKFDYKAGKANGAYTTFTIKQYNSLNTEIQSNTVTGTQNSTYETSSAIDMKLACTKVTITATAAYQNSFIDNIIISVTQPGTSYKNYCTTVPSGGVTLGLDKDSKDDYTYATFSADEPVVFTSDVEVFALEVSGTILKKNELTTGDFQITDNSYESGTVEGGYYVPANTGVMLRSTSEKIAYYYPTTEQKAEDNPEVPTNLLIAGTGKTPVDNDHKYYKLTYNNDGDNLGFYWGADDGAPFLLKKGRAYLKLSKGGSARSFLLFDDEETTGIKAIDNEKLTIDNCYDLSGRKVAQPTKGLYIVNGRKVVIK